MDERITEKMDESQQTPEVDSATAYSATSEGQALILDVREDQELQQVAISGALHIPLGELQRRLDDLPRDRDLYVLCHIGQRSAMATDFLRSLGHERVWNIQGGVIGWIRAGLPTEWGNGELG